MRKISSIHDAIKSFSPNPDGSEKLIYLISWVNYNNSFHRHSVEEGFLQTLTSDRVVWLLSLVHLVLPKKELVGGEEGNAS